MLNDSDADYIHIDIMDGVFVPNISFGFPVTRAIAKHAKKPLDFHLMIASAQAYIQPCLDSGAKIISVHYEAEPHLHRTIDKIKNGGAKAGVVLNPHTPTNVLESILSEIDLVLIMSVNPGFGGQKFIEGSYEKVQQVHKMAHAVGRRDLLIEVDGGVNVNNGAKLVQSGANLLVAGSSIFGAPDPKAEITAFKNLGNTQ